MDPALWQRLSIHWRTAAAWALAAVFAYAAAAKVADPAAFAQAVGNYRLLPAGLAAPAALLLPWWELGAAAALLFPAWRRAGALLALALAAVFAAAVASALLRGLDISCGCFGAGSGRVGWPELLLDAALMAAALAVLYSDRKEMSLELP
jgi:putative oxidoreductase